MRCMTSAKYTMVATVLRSGPALGDDTQIPGYWDSQQDPISGEIIQVWVPVISDDPRTPDVEQLEVPCQVRGVIDGGLRLAGTTEDFGNVYENLDFAKMKFPSSFILSKRDRITSVRDKRTNVVIWKEEELDPVGGEYRATVFDVLGVTPVIDAWGRHFENHALLERAQLQ